MKFCILVQKLFHHIAIVVARTWKRDQQTKDGYCKRCDPISEGRVFCVYLLTYLYLHPHPVIHLQFFCYTKNNSKIIINHQYGGHILPLRFIKVIIKKWRERVGKNVRRKLGFFFISLIAPLGLIYCLPFFQRKYKIYIPRL